jgi:hypothetical protein
VRKKHNIRAMMLLIRPVVTPVVKKADAGNPVILSTVLEPETPPTVPEPEPLSTSRERETPSTVWEWETVSTARELETPFTI